MKILLVTLTLFVSSSSIAQPFWTWPFFRSTIFNQNVYKTKEDLNLIRVYDLDGEASTTIEEFTLEPTDTFPTVKYKVVKEDGDNIYIRILPHAEVQGEIIKPSTEGHGPEPNDDPTDFIYKIVPDEDSGILPSQKYLATERLVGMPITLPIKFRKEDGNLRGQLELSIGYAFGYRIRLNNNPYRDDYINIIPYGFGFNADEYKSSTETEGVESFSLTYWTSGISYEFHGVNVGVFVGRDRMFDDRKDWIYQKKTWFSLGLGFKFGGDK